MSPLPSVFSFALRSRAMTFAVVLGAMCTPPMWSQNKFPLSGNVGIGTSTPTQPLQVHNGPLVIGDDPYMTTNGTAGIALFRFTDGNVYNDFKTISGGKVYFRSGAGTETGYTRFWMTVDPSSGNVGIGTTSPQHLLHVAGTIGAESIVVSSTGADYVFDSRYRLAPLSEVADYIKDHHHLPEIPSAAEGNTEGVDLGAMQSKMLAKIEELTLHMIQAERANLDLRQQNRKLAERIARIERAKESK